MSAVYRIENRMTAYQSLMPFIKEDAVFVPMDASEYQLGEQIQVTLNFAELGKSITFRGTIVWLSFAESVTPSGVGVCFEGNQGKQAQKMLEEYTSDLPTDQPTNTL